MPLGWLAGRIHVQALGWLAGRIVARCPREFCVGSRFGGTSRKPSEAGVKVKLFGTDGIRGKVGRDLDENLARRVAEAAGRYLLGVGQSGFSSQNDGSVFAGALADRGSEPQESADAEKPELKGVERSRAVALGYDTRVSSPSLAWSCAEGLASAGVDVILLGVVPTALVAYAVAHCGLLGGCVVSASHNPPSDNGIKFFGPGGYKLTEGAEREIEKLLDSSAVSRGLSAPLRDVHRTDGIDGTGSSGQGPPGQITEEPAADIVRSYFGYIEEAVGGPLETAPSVILDCANGAAFRLGPAALRRLGADVTAISADGDGSLINVDCGATNPENVAGHLSRSRFAIGLALDGDADRLVAVWPDGTILDGDALLYIFGTWLMERGELRPPKVVATVMSNLGLREALAGQEISVIECPVGDRSVMETMLSEGAVLGGEQSGHIVFGRTATTGDGILTAAMLLRCLSERGTDLRKLLGGFRRYPQVLLNQEVSDKAKVMSSAELAEAISRVSEELDGSGRVLVRASGTEQVVRIMVEARDLDAAQRVAEQLRDTVRAISLS
jgi:phosphoglucosamine mutase